MSKNMYDIPQDYVSSTQEALASGGIQLPFTAPLFWWVNGKAALADLKDIRHYGGWAVDKASMDDALLETGNAALNGLKESQFTASDNAHYNVYQTRYLAIAPITVRRRFIDRSHVQYVVYIANLVPSGDSKVWQPWGAAVLSAKGFAARAIDDALQSWSTKTAKARSEFANNLPAAMFYSPIGTFGDAIITKEVGSTKKSLITPCSTFAPDEVTAEQLEKWFIGRDIIESVNDMQKQAKDWVDAWKDDGQGVTPQSFQQVAQEPEQPSYDEDLPF